MPMNPKMKTALKNTGNGLGFLVTAIAYSKPVAERTEIDEQIQELYKRRTEINNGLPTEYQVDLTLE